MRTGKLVRVSLATVALVVLGGGEAFAFLQSGTLLTNAASATYLGGGQTTSVTYSATAKILVANPAMFMWKDDTPTVVGTAGGTVTYLICFSNGGANTAFNVTIKDRLPNNTFWLTLGYSAWVSGGTIADSYGSTANGPWTDGPLDTTLTDMTPSGAGLFLQWVASPVGVGKSGCITFLLSIG